jgi:hypothetical protein
MQTTLRYPRTIVAQEAERISEQAEGERAERVQRATDSRPKLLTNIEDATRADA